MSRALQLVSATVTTVLRGGLGMRVSGAGARPDQPLEVFEFEGCPFCRKVREALSILDLEAQIRPCPKGGTRFRDELKRIGGKLQFPYLRDPNTGEAMYESGDIVRYLYARYGTGDPPWALGDSGLSTLAVAASGLGRGTAGSFVMASMPWTPQTAQTQRKEPLELYSFEASPFCRLVREVLCELELPYLLHNVAKGSARRAAFIERSGKMQVPYLVDPNTGTEMFESADIIDYLRATYAASAAHPASSER